MKPRSFQFLLTFGCAFATGCCNNCDMADDQMLSLQVFDKATGANTTSNFSFSNFSLAQTVRQGFSLIPSLEFKQNETSAVFPLNCGQTSPEACFGVMAGGQALEKITAAGKTITGPCCNCNHSAATISSITTQSGPEVVLSPGANVLKIRL
ncbi:MAG: hypothetical protein EPO28_18365 [Saprospiraceae bacterium]|nr:MAG: hypothetical protein EPO28_18365 [Saprospiraceae bacterium]